MNNKKILKVLSAFIGVAGFVVGNLISKCDMEEMKEDIKKDLLKELKNEK